MVKLIVGDVDVGGRSARKKRRSVEVETMAMLQRHSWSLAVGPEDGGER